MGLRAQALHLQRGGTDILKGVDFRAGDGQLVGVLGPSGSGKSTLLLAMAGFWRADKGRVTLDGQDLYASFEQLKRDIGFVPQDDIVHRSLTVESVLSYAAKLRLPDFSDDARQGRVDGVIHTLDLANRRDHRVRNLSGGQRKRVSVGVELVMRPRVLFADEPTSGLDPALEHELTGTFRQLTEDGSIVVLTTHVMTSIDMLDLLCVIHGGRVAYFGPTEQVKGYFNVDDFADIFRRLEEGSPLEWARRYASEYA
jgi:ABC-type multidrug transport system ATPase subunit